ncbi:MAG: hypothetical protein GX247_00745, partial [Mollicutes bacterium]|nr:hypothetical protein [Mollicutes bacterium]
KTDEKPNLDNTEYTDHEKDGQFELRYIPLNEVEQTLKENADKYGDKHGIPNEIYHGVFFFIYIILKIGYFWYNEFVVSFKNYKTNI